MSSNNDDLIRRTKVSTKPIKSRRDESDGDSSRRNEPRRNRRRVRSIRNHRTALVLLAWTVIVAAAVVFLRLRTSRNESGTTPKHGDGMPLGLGTGNGIDGKMRYLDPRQLPPLPGEPDEPYKGKGRKGGFRGEGDDEWKADAQSEKYLNHGPKVDYTKHAYQYPELIFEPPNDGSYPPLERMQSIFETWEQDDIDQPPDTLVEVLQHFDYQDPDQLEVCDLMDH